MKGLKGIAAIAGIVFLGLAAVLAATNPSQESYEDFALQQLNTYLEESVCAKTPGGGIQIQCDLLLKSNQSGIRRLISRGTQHKNFVLFSIYTTDLSISSLLPSYHVEAVGVLQQFQIYQAKQR